MADKNNIPVMNNNIAPFNEHLFLETRQDNKSVRINHRSYDQTSGNTVAMRVAPSQTASTTGDVIGAEFTPRVQSGVNANQIKGIHVDTDMKGTTARTIGHLKAIEVEFGSDAGSNVTVTNDAAAIQVRNFLQGVTVTGDVCVLNIQAHEGVAWECFAKFPSQAGFALEDGAPAVLPANTGYIRVKVGATYFKIPLYAD